MTFTAGEIAGLIAAIAFAILALVACFVLFKVAGVVGNLNTTVDEVNKSLGTITKDTDHLLIEVEGLLNKSNSTLDDVNGKLGLTNPLFKAVGDLGVSVSSLNDSTVRLTQNLAGKNAKKSEYDYSNQVGDNVTTQDVNSTQVTEPINTL